MRASMIEPGSEVVLFFVICRLITNIPIRHDLLVLPDFTMFHPEDFSIVRQQSFSAT